MTEHCHHHDHEADCLHVNRYQEAFNQFDTHVHDEDIHAAVCRLLEEKKAQYDTPEVKKALLGTIELTTLKVTDSQESVLKFTERVNAFADAHP